MIETNKVFTSEFRRFLSKFKVRQTKVVEQIERLFPKRKSWVRFPSGQTKDCQTLQLQLLCLTFSIKRDSVKPPPCVVDKWQLVSKTAGLFAVSWPRQRNEYNVITITRKKRTRALFYVGDVGTRPPAFPLQEKC